MKTVRRIFCWGIQYGEVYAGIFEETYDENGVIQYNAAYQKFYKCGRHD